LKAIKNKADIRGLNHGKKCIEEKENGVMKKEDLKELGIDDEIIAKVMDLAAEELKGFIPKGRFDEVNGSLKELKDQIVARDKQLEELGKKVKDNDEFTKQIKDLQDENEKASKEYDQKIKEIKLDNAIKLKLKDSKAKYEDLLMTKFDREKLNIKEDGSVEGLEDQFKLIQEGYKDLFDQPLSGTPPANNGGSASSTNPLTAELEKAQKEGNTALVVSLTRKLYEEKQS
jgi:Phage minor structural protein GP20